MYKSWICREVAQGTERLYCQNAENLQVLRSHAPPLHRSSTYFTFVGATCRPVGEKLKHRSVSKWNTGSLSSDSKFHRHCPRYKLDYYSTAIPCDTRTRYRKRWMAQAELVGVISLDLFSLCSQKFHSNPLGRAAIGPIAALWIGNSVIF